MQRKSPRTQVGPKRRLNTNRGQIGPLGIVLIVGIVLIGTVAVVTIGGTAISDTQRASQLQHVEHSMSQFDSREAVVAHGEGDVQSVSLGDSGRGQYNVEENTGWIRVVHHNYVNGANETIYNGTLGALVYRNDDTTLAFQGGGVWHSDGTGSVMVSPPEFHYQSETLVLPVTSVHGDTSVSGPTQATVTKLQPTTRIFPSRATDNTTGVGVPYDATNADYLNPIKGGKVSITVNSEFYQGWGHYFKTRTEGNVTLNHARQTATVELTAPRTLGDFDMPSEGNAIDIRGMPEGHAVDEFSIVLAPDDADAANFFNLQWSLYVKDGNQEFEIHLRLSGESDDPATLCKEQDVAISIYYSDTNGNPYDGWQNEHAFQSECTDRDGDGAEDEVQLAVNFTGNTSLEISDLSSSDLMHFNPSGSDHRQQITFDEHASEVNWEPVTYSANESVSVNRLINHYFGLLGPDFDLVVDDKNSDTVSESDSTGVLRYEGDGRVTFMHITDNQVRIDLEAGGQ